MAVSKVSSRVGKEHRARQKETPDTHVGASQRREEFELEDEDCGREGKRGKGEFATRHLQLQNHGRSNAKVERRSEASLRLSNPVTDRALYSRRVRSNAC